MCYSIYTRVTFHNTRSRVQVSTFESEYFTILCGDLQKDTLYCTLNILKYSCSRTHTYHRGTLWCMSRRNVQKVWTVRMCVAFHNTKCVQCKCSILLTGSQVLLGIFYWRVLASGNLSFMRFILLFKTAHFDTCLITFYIFWCGANKSPLLFIF